MEHISVKRKIDKTIVTHKIEKNEQINTMVLDIINKREISRLLPVMVKKTLGGGRKLRFVVQNFNDLQSLMKSEMDFGNFADIVMQVVETLQACESHGIPSGNLELTPDLTFYEYGKRTVYLICWPVISLSAPSRVAGFFLDLGSMYVSRPDEEKYQKGYLQFFDSRAKFDLLVFKAYVEQLLKQWQESQHTGMIGKSSRSKAQVEIPRKESNRTPSIRRESTGAVIELSKSPFSLGRAAEACDYAIDNNRAVSKKHVTITSRSGTYFIRDNGSLNGTLLDGERLPPNEDVELTSGASFRIGNENFIFSGK